MSGAGLLGMLGNLPYPGDLLIAEKDLYKTSTEFTAKDVERCIALVNKETGYKWEYLHYLQAEHFCVHPCDDSYEFRHLMSQIPAAMRRYVKFYRNAKQLHIKLTEVEEYVNRGRITSQTLGIL